MSDLMYATDDEDFERINQLDMHREIMQTPEGIFVAKISINNCTKYLEYLLTREDAARACDNAAMKLRGQLGDFYRGYTMADLMYAAEVWKIGVRGVGNVVLDHHNKGRWDCVKCGDQIEAGKGFRFTAQKYASERSGFWCQTCVGDFILTEKNWSYNPIMGILFPTWPMVTPIETKSIHEVWMKGGERALFKFLSEEK